MKGRTRVVFVSVKDGDIIEQEGSGEAIHFVGFKPGRASKREGWLVYLIHEGSAVKSKSWPPGSSEVLRIPKSTGIHKRRQIA